MTTNPDPNDRQLEQQLEQAASDRPLDSQEHDSHTHELRAGWNAFCEAQKATAAQQPPLDVEALWNYAQQADDEPAPSQPATASAGAMHSRRLLFLAATAATLAIAAFGIWNLVDSSSENAAPEIVNEEPVVAPAVPPLDPEPQIVQQETPSEVELPEQSLTEPDQAASEPTDLYAWNDELDESIASAESSAHDIRYGWRNTSESYRYISTRFESIDDSLSNDSL